MIRRILHAYAIFQDQLLVRRNQNVITMRSFCKFSAHRVPCFLHRVLGSTGKFRRSSHGLPKLFYVNFLRRRSFPEEVFLSLSIH